MATYIKVNNQLYQTSSINGKIADKDWGGRMSKAITLTMTFSTADALFVDNISWSIVQDTPTDEEPQHQDEYDNSDYSMAGDIIDHRDGTVTVKMGKPTALEEAQLINDILIGGAE